MNEYIQTDYLPNGYLINEKGEVKSPYNKILKQAISNSGYYFINIKNKGYFIHRALCFAFKSAVIGKDYVNHINGIKTDNRLENLEWVTKSENVKHCYDNGLKKYKPLHYKNKKGFEHNRSKSVLCIENGVVYGSQSEAQRILKLSNGSVSWAIKKNKKIKGFSFKFVNNK